MIDPLIILLALLCGVIVRKLGYPPMLGYLVAGFLLHSLPIESGEVLDTVANAGVTLLLFTIGLKLKIRELAAPQVWGVASVHMVLSIAIIAAMLFAALALFPAMTQMDAEAVWVIAFALSFSSTVFAVQALERTNESGSLAGRIAVGVLILQDVFAVAYLVIAQGEWPSPWALLVIPAFVLLRPVVGWLLDRSGHGEVLVLFGFTLAVGLGAGIFDLVGLKRSRPACCFRVTREPKRCPIAC